MNYEDDDECLPGIVQDAMRTSVLHRSGSDEVGKRDERDPDGDEKNGAGNEIREDHEKQSTYHRDDCFLLFAIDKKAQADRAEDQSPEEP